MLLFACGLFLCSPAQQKPTTAPLFKNAVAPLAARVKDLLSKMTIEEKAGQLNQLNGGVFTGPAANDAGQQAKLNMVKKGMVGSFLNVVGAKETRAAQEVAVKESRLGIPLLFAYDVIHGYKTIFPIPLAEACSWDLKGIEANSGVSAKEASSAGLHWTFAPMCDISTDPRWGRVMEGAGEDTYYGAQVAAARVKGLQGNLSDVNHIMACVKHFAVYGAVEAGREYNFVDVSRVQLWNKYLPPYKAAVDAGAATVMNSFNVFEGVPASGNKYLVTDILKKRWGFKGFVVSDWGSFGEMIAHGYATDNKDVAMKALNAGSMMDMETKAVIEYLPQLVKEGKVSMQLVDDAVSRILYYKFKLGLFEDPYRFSNEANEKATLMSAANLQQAREAAKHSIVLLKNNNNVLPLSSSTKIAVIGFYANSKPDLFDFWIAQGNPNEATTILDGLKKKFINTSFSDGYTADANTSDSLIAAAVKASENAEVIVVNLGISGKLAGEDRALAKPEIPAGQIELLKALQKTNKPIVALISSGRPLVLTQLQPLVNSIVQCWILGTTTGDAVADIVSGDYNPSAKTVMSFPYAIGQIPVYYNHFNTSRPSPEDGSAWVSRYRDIPNAPLYPFGFGLSYTSFAYSNLTLSAVSITKNKKIIATVTVANTGKKDGEEVVQLYIRDITASIIRPVKELKAFEKISLKAGESKTVSFTLSPKDLSFFDADGKVIFEAGKFTVFVGGNSRDVIEKGFVVE